MNHHDIAWKHVRPHFFKDVIEVTRQVPWGFKQDDPLIENISLDTFLEFDFRAGTILLHILSGEGEDRARVSAAIKKAKRECVKLLILEHNPEEWGKSYCVDYIRDTVPNFIEESWGRNMLFYGLTTEYLWIPELNDAYVDAHIGVSFVTPQDEGIDKNYLVYTHTSEEKIRFEIPEGTVYWVIGGGLAYESMKEANENILFDSILKQVLVCANVYETYQWKIEKIWKDVCKVHHMTPNHNQWRFVWSNNVCPNKIIHKDIKNLKISNCTVYTSTIEEKYWEHLKENNNIIESITKRDTPRLCLKK